MFFRLERQAPYLKAGDQSAPLPDFRRLANLYMSPHLSKFARISPLGSASLGSSITRILNGCSSIATNPTATHNRFHRRDTVLLHEAIQFATHGGTKQGGDEALYGRVGLLWSILNIRQYNVDVGEIQGELGYTSGAVQRLVDLILETGRSSAGEYSKRNGKSDTLPLMWLWHDRYYLGA
jgi:hypothetical protein